MQLIKLAWRSIWRNRRRTIITIVSMVLGLLIAFFFIAFAEGTYSKMTDNAVRMLGGHVTLEHPEYRDAPAVDMTVGGLAEMRRRIEKLPEVERTKVLVLGQGVAKSGGGAVGVAVVGVEPSAEKGSSPMHKKIIAGEYLDDADQRKVIIGSQLAKQLKLGKRKDAVKLAEKIRPWIEYSRIPLEEVVEDARMRLAVGKKMVIATTNINGDMVEELLRVKGIFSVGAVEIDGYMIQIPVDTARRIYGMQAGEATQLGVVVRDPDTQDQVLAKVRQMASREKVSVLPWDEVMPDLAAYIEVDGGSNFVFQGILIFLIMFVIFNTLLMSVLERRREFAVLLALGTPPGKLKLQIVVETVFIALIGCVLGLLAGWGVTYPLAKSGIDISAMYEEGVSISGYAIDPIIYPWMSWELAAWLGGLVFAATMLLSLYPMRKAAQIEVADLLRGGQ
jgi:ABC-type lipoprotein release transport system permease subunit